MVLGPLAVRFPAAGVASVLGIAAAVAVMPAEPHQQPEHEHKTQQRAPELDLQPNNSSWE